MVDSSTGISQISSFPPVIDAMDAMDAMKHWNCGASHPVVSVVFGVIRRAQAARTLKNWNWGLFSDCQS
jgi:hypothetical protein